MLGETVLDLLAPSGVVRIDRQRCLHRRFARSSCRRCVESCPNGALTMNAGPQLDARHCNACGRCVAACPVEALGGEDGGVERLAVHLTEQTAPVLGCRREGVSANVRCDCLGALETEGLLALTLLFPAGATLNLSRCAGCDKPETAERLTALLDGVQRLPGMNGRWALRLATQEVQISRSEVDLSRRAFFTFFGRRSQETAIQAVARRFATEPSPRQKSLSGRRRLLLTALERLPVVQRTALEEALLPRIVFTERCTACTGCAGICPTGAIAVDDGETIRPILTRQFCTGCGLCVEFCRKGGIALSEPEVLVQATQGVE